MGVAVAAFGACSELPQAPARSSARDAGTSPSYATSTTETTGTTVDALLWTKKVSQKTVTKTIGPAGGSLSIPNGIQVTVPAGAVSTNVRFSVTRIAGGIVAYDFQPHGITFAVPVQIAQPTLGTNLFKQPPLTDFQGAYYPTLSSLDQASGTATVTEFEPTRVSADKAWIHFTVQHFSGYLVAMGRH